MRSEALGPGPHAPHSSTAQTVLGTIWKDNEPSEGRVRGPPAERRTCLKRDRLPARAWLWGRQRFGLGHPLSAPLFQIPHLSPRQTPAAAPDAARPDRRLRTVCPAGRSATWGQALSLPGVFPEHPRSSRDGYGPLITGVTSRHTSHAHSAPLTDRAGAGTRGGTSNPPTAPATQRAKPPPASRHADKDGPELHPVPTRDRALRRRGIQTPSCQGRNTPGGLCSSPSRCSWGVTASSPLCSAAPPVSPCPHVPSRPPLPPLT